MIKSITVTNHLGESMKMELKSPEQSGFIIQSVEGLGPSVANINVTEMSTTDGALYNSARVATRNIVLKLKLLEFPTIEHTRQLTYKYFPIKKKIWLLIETDNRVCETYGYVESNEPNIFSNNETVQISVICPDPYFYSPNNTITTFSGVDPLFEFEFSNESLTDDLIEFGDIRRDTARNVLYTGDGNVGVLIKMHISGAVTNIAIYNSQTRESMIIDTDKIHAIINDDLKAGDDIIISTIKGDKFIYLLRDGVYINILNSLEMNSDWFTLAKGDNVFIYTAETGILNIMFRVENKIMYEGV